MAKYAHCQLPITDDAGNLMTGATVEVRDEESGALASLKSNRDGNSTKTNPFTASDGYADFYVTGGAYKITATLGGETVTLRYRGVGTAAEYDINEVSRWSFAFSTTGLLGDGEELPALATPVAVTIPADCEGSSAAAADGAATGSAVIQFKYSTNNGATWTNAFTCTFAPASRTGVFALAADLSLPARALLRPVGPATHDPTLEGFTALIDSIID